MVWTCHEERPRLCRKKDDGNGVTRKEEKRGRPKGRILDIQGVAAKFRLFSILNISEMTCLIYAKLKIFT